jgi:molybdopterin/thiamine biosynthesis adenylyltransferase
MNASERIADRHLREVDGLAPASGMRPLTVGLVADAAWAASPAGQHVLACAVNLLSRLTETVTRLMLAIPAVPVVVPMPYGHAVGTLRDALAAIPPWAVGNEVSVEIVEQVSGADMVLSLGPPPATPAGAPVLCAIADRWRLWVGLREHLPPDVEVRASATPLGPYLAASFLVGEVFKTARGVVRGRAIQSLGYSLWTGATGEWPALEAGPELAGHTLPPFYLVGAGAVGQGVAAILGATPLSGAYVVAIDDDHHDRTNLNRCFVAGEGDVGNAKVQAVARYLGRSPIVCLPHEGTVVQYVQKPKPSLQADLARAEADGRYGTVVSCVDRGTSRQDIQGLQPSLIIGGSTVGLSAKTNVYDFSPGTPCLACHNPPEKDGERLRELERLLRAMSREEQDAYLRAHVPDPGPILEHLAAERCGTVGEAMLRDIATASPREFSVSFVSMAAAVLAASRLFSRLLFNGADRDRPGMTSIAFLKGSVLDADLAVDATCPRHAH